MPKPLKPRQSLINGNTVTMQRRNIKLSKPQWHTKFREQYATEKEARVAAYVWDKKGIPLLAQDFEKRRKPVFSGQKELFQQGAPI